jgi:diguanylate cyclase (GGDEF)-like protein
MEWAVSSSTAEPERVAALRALGLLDTGPDERFDRITRLAQRIFDVPIALVSLMDEDRQWFKSHPGLDLDELPRDGSLCSHAISGDDVFHVRDAAADPRFADSPLVHGDLGIRFYASQPIVGPTGHKLGVVCIVDRVPRDLSPEDATTLRDLAVLVEQAIAATYLVAVDQLTGLSNRRGFETLAQQALAMCERHRLNATLMYIDLDRLKPINDELGHEAGDRALREFATLLIDTFRSSDVIARLGGDEFAVLLSGSAAATEPTQRLAAAIAARNASGSHEYLLAASVGCGEFDPERPVTLAELVESADRSMYSDKRRRRATG